jgi:hypothetical protein
MTDFYLTFPVISLRFLDRDIVDAPFWWRYHSSAKFKPSSLCSSNSVSDSSEDEELHAANANHGNGAHVTPPDWDEE